MNKNWLVLFAILLILEYNNGYKKSIIIDDPNFKVTYPTTVIKLQGKARGHRKYIDMRMVKDYWIYEFGEE